MRFFVLPAAMLLTAIGIACSGGSAATDEETSPTTTAPASTVTGTAPIPAPPWATSSPAGGAASPTAVENDPTSTVPPTNTPVTVPNTPVPTQTEPAPTATPNVLQGPLSASVSVQDNFFSPFTATIAAGGTVTWTLNGEVDHNIVGPGFDSGIIGPGQSFTFTFASPGTYSYKCTIHQYPRQMSGVVEVQ